MNLSKGKEMATFDCILRASKHLHFNIFIFSLSDYATIALAFYEFRFLNVTFISKELLCY